MKRKIGSVDKDIGSRPNKKKRVEDPVPTDLVPMLPTDVWRIILDQLGDNYMDDTLKEQRKVRLVSKSTDAMVIKIWHLISATKWPQLYQKFMKNLTNEKFVPLFTKMMLFGSNVVEISSSKPKFKSVHCPICNTKLKDFTFENDLIFVRCDNCTNHYEAESKWQLYYIMYTCKACQKETPFGAFECESCDESYCWECNEEYRYPGPVDGNWDRAHCKDCVVACDHCDGEMGTAEGGTCYKCKLPQCDMCERYGTCENSDEEDDDNSKHSDKEEDSSGSQSEEKEEE